MTREELWTQLSEAGLVSGDLPIAAESQSPWPVRAMLGIAGWMGALFLLGFLGATFSELFRSASSALPAGAICCAGAYFIFAAAPESDFFAQFGLATSLAGQVLLAVAIADLFGGRPSAGGFLAMAAVEAALAVAIPNYIHRVFSALAANFCIFLAAAVMEAPVIATTVASIGAVLIWLDQVRMGGRPSFWEPVGYGFAIALLHLDGSLMAGPLFWRGMIDPPSMVLQWLSPVVAGVVFVYAVWRLRERAGVSQESRAGLFTIAAAAVLALCGIWAPGISAAILVLILGFANRNRVLMGLGLLAFGGYLSHFYYQLSSTLLMKSIILGETGIALLALRYAMARLLPEESPHA